MFSYKSSLDFILNALARPLRVIQNAFQHNLRDTILSCLGESPVASFAPFHGRLEFPTEYPPGCDENIMLMNGKIPTVVLTPQLCRTLQDFIKSTKRIERVESIFTMDRAAVSQHLDRIISSQEYMEDKKRKMLHTIELFEGDEMHGAKCPYTRAQVSALDDKIKEWDVVYDKWAEEAKKVILEVQEERAAAWIQPIELAKSIERVLQHGGLLPDEQES